MADSFAWSLERRVMRRVLITPTGCWEWQGAKMRNGYGQLSVGGQKWAVHRYAYTEKIGPIHCPQNHSYDPANTRRTRNGGRACRTCERLRAARNRRARRGED